ncbi:hypothetical protein MCOR29_002798 [Pyricularia oryzae]|uniref:Uncharacterized protein n=1 Tax=Pyricularia grisea TaxID=148305 RepID=A0ABQ8N217_PYRGI|nr:hypothetical protein MCOR34_011780 [Pyricularia oryzae]KAI6289922.1 hypothetical protein MCOR33_011646 [Pyricularia grisea]KAI6327772.1 hypothetical protein MCOR29_002798 [Pyricularia oryzae]KAI6480099.1 hypothetical protein MCOR11_011704 [Pyricularia oryzae]
MHFFQNTTTLAQLTLKPTAKASKAAMNIACDILMEIAEKAAKLIPRLVDQAVKLSSEAVDGAKFLAEKVGENIPDAATQTAQDIPTNYGKAAAVILGTSGIAMVAAPAVLPLPALGAVGFSASRPIAGEFGYWGKTFRNGDKQSSIAAAAQSGLGSVVAPSLFATCQSAAMGGYGAATVFGLVQVVGGAMAVSAGTVIGRMNSWL